MGFFSNIGHLVPKTLEIISPLAQCYQKSFQRWLIVLRNHFFANVSLRKQNQKDLTFC
jgi:hypothetical protein